MSGEATGGRRRLRVALLCFHTSPLGRTGGRDAGGMNVYVRETASRLAALGHEVDVFTRSAERGPAVQQLAPGARLIRVAAGPARALDKQRLPELVPQFANGVAAFRLAEGRRYDLLHSHYWLSGTAALLLQRRWQVPHVTMFHTLGEVKNRARLGEHEPVRRIEAERRIVDEASRIVCATEHERGLLRSLYGAVEARIVTIPCGVDADLFVPADRESAKRRLGFAGERAVVYAGRIEPLKGLDIVVGALAQLDEPRPLLVVVGGDHHAAAEVRRLQAAAAAAGVLDRVRFVGAVPQAELAVYLAAADVCVVPSFYESFGMVALEAQACGTPVVASRVGGLPGVVRDGETGYLVPWRCPEPFAERLDLLLRNDGLRRSLGRTAREWAERFRWESVAARLVGLYESVLTEQALGGCHPRPDLDSKADHTRCDVA
jgi:D-inositol-3-phosphate glycosyltransferase